MRIKGLDLKYLLRGCYIRSISGNIDISTRAYLNNVEAYVYKDGSLSIGPGCILKNCVISVMSGKIELLSNVIIIGKKHEPVQIIIDNGSVYLASHVKLCCKRVWVRFGGSLNIGEYTNINDGSEIRCDESVSIGSFNQISYNVRIWDTNTHSKLSKEQRRYVTETRFPYFGFEESRPKTAPVIIGDDCWIGESAAILKGSTIGDRSIIGFGTFISGKDIPSDRRAVNERRLHISPL